MGNVLDPLRSKQSMNPHFYPEKSSIERRTGIERFPCSGASLDLKKLFFEIKHLDIPPQNKVKPRTLLLLQHKKEIPSKPGQWKRIYQLQEHRENIKNKQYQRCIET